MRLIALVAVLLLGFAVAVAAAQEPPASGEGPVTTETTVTTPDPVEEETGDPAVTDPEPTSASPEDELAEQTESPPARAQSPQEQREEAADICRTSGGQLPTSGMRSARQGAVGEDDGSLLFLIAGVAVALFAFGYLWRRFRGPLMPRNQTPLERAGAILAVVAGIAGLAAQFIPGVGIRDRPAPQSAMEVRQVHARVKYADFARAVDAARRPATSIAGRALGNVAWVELQLDGYRDQDLTLDWAEYNVDTGGAYLPETQGSRRLRVEHDHETRFEPVWFGYPRTGRFQVQFRLLNEHGQVRAMTRTGPMRGTRYRYSC